jgi:hypothetical protein
MPSIFGISIAIQSQQSTGSINPGLTDIRITEEDFNRVTEDGQTRETE